jgi:hypothetical protein
VSKASPEVEPERPDAEPTLAGLACRAIRAAGIDHVNPGDPALQRLLAAGLTPAELASTAVELAAKGKPRPALLFATVEGRRADAARARPAASGRTAPAADDWETRPGVEAKAATAGLPPWDECVPFSVFRDRVRAATKGATP